LSKWLDLRAYPILDESGELIQVIEHLRDITREKQAEAELKAAHERLITILDSVEAHIYVADIDSYQVLFANQKMKKDFRCDPVGAACYESFCGLTRPCAHCTNHRLLDANGVSTGPCIWEARNTLIDRWFLNVDRAIRWVDGRMVRLQIATDITRAKELEQERTRMEAQLQQSQKFEAIATLAGGVAHDFNNLLMGIQGRASLMMTELTAVHPHWEHLRAIEEHIRSAAGLTGQLLGFARGGKYEVKTLDLNELAASSAAMFGRTKKEIRIHSKLQAAPLLVEADRGQIEQVLLNLYVNAWQAMPDGGELYLETRSVALDGAFCSPYRTAPGGYAKLTVTDTGIGMDAATRQRIFDPFFTTKEKGRGTGLGLASAYGIIRKPRRHDHRRKRTGRRGRLHDLSARLESTALSATAHCGQAASGVGDHPAGR
jgi:signal transduction histidine kinase